MFEYSDLSPMASRTNQRSLLFALCVSLALALFVPGGANSAQVEIPNSRIDIDDEFVFDMNSSGEYVVAWSPESSKLSTVVRGSAATGPIRTWTVRTGWAGPHEVAIAESGTMAIAWTQVKYGRRTNLRTKKGAVWNVNDETITAHELTRTRQDVFDDLGEVDLAVNASGTAAFTWSSGLRAQRVGFASIHPDGSRTPTATLHKNRRPGLIGDPIVAIDDSGAVAVRWSHYGVRCREDWFVPRNCRNSPPLLMATSAPAALQFSHPQVFGKGCEWGDTDSNGAGQLFALVGCRSGLRYTTSTIGQPFAALQRFSTLPGSDHIFQPNVSVLSSGRVRVVWESFRRSGRAGEFAQIAGTSGRFGSPLGPPTQLTEEVDISDSENQGGYQGRRAAVLEGPEQRAYLTVMDSDSNVIHAMNETGFAGPPLELPQSAYPFNEQIGIAGDGIGFVLYADRSTWSKSRREWRYSLWTTTFAFPPAA